MIHSRHLTFVVVLACAAAAHAATPAPTVTFWDPQAAEALRAKTLANDASTRDAVAWLTTDAAKRMTNGPFSVVDKELVPPSGDKHDFSTLGRYYWPNPETKDGMPWVVIDGKTNPDYFDGKTGDTQRMFDLFANVSTLSKAAYFNGDKAAGDRAALLIRTWFLNPATRMNPNANYAARLPGKWDGRAFGILSTVRPFTDIVDCTALLTATGSWTADDQKAFAAWFDEYRTWLTTSDFGIKEAAEKNNHGTAYDILVTRIALLLGDVEGAKKILEAAKHRRIDAHIEPDGSQPLELKRAQGWHYSRYNVEFYFRLAALGDAAGVDLWNYKSADGRSIRGALDYLVANALKDPEIAKGVEIGTFGPMLQVAARVYDEPKYLAAAKQLGYDDKLTFNDAGQVSGALGRGGKK